MLQKLVFPNTPGLTSILFNITKKRVKFKFFFIELKFNLVQK